MPSRPSLATTLLLGVSLLGCPASDAPRLRQQVVLKSGRALEGHVIGAAGGILDFVGTDGEPLPLARIHVRAVEGAGPFSDPPILWRDVPAPATDEPERFLRLTRGDDGTGSLDVAVVAYASDDGSRRVYLVGAVHVARQPFYDAVQAVLDSMDQVLWEGVGGTEKPSREALERFDVLFRTQVLLKNILNLDFQLEGIDYERSFWRNSDMTMNALQAVLDERGLELIPNEELFRLVFGTLFKFIDPEKVPRNETIGRSYRAMVAPMMADAEALLERIGTPALRDVLIGMRNEVVIDDVQAWLETPGPERLAVFYGAAHLPGLDEALRQRMGLHFLGLHWIPAWTF